MEKPSVSRSSNPECSDVFYAAYVAFQSEALNIIQSNAKNLESRAAYNAAFKPMDRAEFEAYLSALPAKERTRLRRRWMSGMDSCMKQGKQADLRATQQFDEWGPDEETVRQTDATIEKVRKAFRDLESHR